MAISLPSRATVQGAVARLLLAEARGPGQKSYSEGETKTAMQWMKRVLQNRLENKPSQFGAPGATTLIDIIKAKNQFAGFSNYPSYDNDLVSRLQQFIDIANDTKDQRNGLYAKFVQNAIDVANATTVPDPSQAENPKNNPICGWRTMGAGSPGGRFVKYKDQGGNTFYTLTP